VDGPERYPFSTWHSGEADSSLLPLLPILLESPAGSVQAPGLLDTGATVNVLPLGLGLQLGLRWDEQVIPLNLSGNLANFEARAVIVESTVGSFAPVRLAFAWTMAEEVPLILGQVNFFLQFDVCFYRSLQIFDVRPRNGSRPAG
jgi:hypothetical protein